MHVSNAAMFASFLPVPGWGGGGLMAPDAVAQSRVGRGPVSLWYVEEMVVSGRLAKIVTLSTENGSERSVT